MKAPNFGRLAEKNVALEQAFLASMPWAAYWRKPRKYETHLFDIENNPGQLQPIMDVAVEKGMVFYSARQGRSLMRPRIRFERLGLQQP